MGPFDRVAAPYDRAMLPLEWALLRRLRARVIPALRGRVLELGAGTGVNLAHYAPSVRLLVTDASPAMLRIAAARPRPEGSDLLVANAEALPLEPESVDHVMASLVFCSVVDPDRAAGEIWRVLRPGGTLSLIEHMQGATPVAGFLTRSLTRPWLRINGACHLDRETVDTVRRVGLRVEREERYLGGIVRVVRATK